jgi:hypothetical protein
MENELDSFYLFAYVEHFEFYFEQVERELFESFVWMAVVYLAYHLQLLFV